MKYVLRIPLYPNIFITEKTINIEGITKEKRSQVEFKAQKQQLMQTAKDYFEQTMDEYDLDAFLSIDNYSARNAAAAHFLVLHCSPLDLQ